MSNKVQVRGWADFRRTYTGGAYDSNLVTSARKVPLWRQVYSFVYSYLSLVKARRALKRSKS